MKKFMAVAVAFLYSLFNMIVGPMIKAQQFKVSSTMVAKFFIGFFVFSVFNILMVFLLQKASSRRMNQTYETKATNTSRTTLFCVTWLIIFLSWVPAYLVTFPGILSYDIISQMNSAMGQITNNHHPVLHTWLIRVFMEMGSKIFHSYEAGLGMLSLVQMIMLSYALARLSFLLVDMNVPIIPVIVSILFSATWFMNACLSVTMVKDVLHAAFLVLFSCHFADIVIAPSEYIQDKKNYVLLPTVSFFMCAFRNNGLHIYVFCFLILAALRFRYIKSIKKYTALLIAIVVPVLLFKVYTGPVFNLLNIEQGQVREALCVPIQQLQRVALYHADELTDEQTKTMKYYIDDLEWMSVPVERYDPFMADPAKSCFYSDSYNNNPVAFWKFYISVGKQFSKEYIVAFLSNTLGYWYPGYYDYTYVMYNNYSPEDLARPVERKSIINSQALDRLLTTLCLSPKLREIPVLRLFFVPGFAPWILLLLIIFSWDNRRFWYDKAPLFLPIIAQYGIMLLSPMSSFRYSWPFFLLLPVSFVALMGNSFIKENEKNSRK